MLKINSIAVHKLHDVYSYNLDLTKSANDQLSIFYGDNGSGKTTLLKILYHLLSSASDRGHLTAISNIPFFYARVSLSDGTIISAHKENPPSGYPLHMSIERAGGKKVSYWYAPERYKSSIAEQTISAEIAKLSGRHKSASLKQILTPAWIRGIRDSTLERFSEEAHAAYCEALQQLEITIYFLGTDRRILSDAIEQFSFASTKDQPERPEDQISNLRAAYLRDALQRAGRHLNRQIIRASNVGSKNVNDTYAELFRRILKQDNQAHHTTKRGLRSLLAELRWIQRRQRRFVKLGLSPDLDVGTFFGSISETSPQTTYLLKEVLEPFVATLRARLDAMEPIRESVETFILGLNDFFRFKNIEYLPSKGFEITGPLGQPLDVKQLSSGEQQLLLIFCSVLAAGESPNIFIIDEPEISLNVKWQREILSSLRKITQGADHQMMISTHSIELLTQHAESVIVLDPTIGGSVNSIHDTEGVE